MADTTIEVVVIPAHAANRYSIAQYMGMAVQEQGIAGLGYRSLSSQAVLIPVSQIAAPHAYQVIDVMLNDQEDKP